MTRLLLVRHGETDWNAHKRYLGQTDIPLNPAGQAQAARLAGRLRGETFDRTISSDLGRAAATAALLAGSAQLETDTRLREIAFGAFEGLTYSQLQARYPAELAAWQADPNAAPPGGESLLALAARVAAFLADLRAQAESACVLVVSHGGPLRVLICLALGLPVERHWQMRLDLASLSEISLYDSGAILSLLNDTGHLRAGPSAEDQAAVEAGAAMTRDSDVG